METKAAKDSAEREEEEEMRKIMMAKFAGTTSGKMIYREIYIQAAKRRKRRTPRPFFVSETSSHAICEGGHDYRLAH